MESLSAVQPEVMVGQNAGQDSALNLRK